MFKSVREAYKNEQALRRAIREFRDAAVLVAVPTEGDSAFDVVAVRHEDSPGLIVPRFQQRDPAAVYGP